MLVLMMKNPLLILFPLKASGMCLYADFSYLHFVYEFDLVCFLPRYGRTVRSYRPVPVVVKLTVNFQVFSFSFSCRYDRVVRTFLPIPMVVKLTISFPMVFRFSAKLVRPGGTGAYARTDGR
jgi:hypothetical protein